MWGFFSPSFVPVHDGQAKKIHVGGKALFAMADEKSEQLAELAEALRAQIKASYDAAMPQLQAAIHALDSLDKREITELRSFAHPPATVLFVLEAVAILFGADESPFTWKTAKVMLSHDFVDRLKSYDKDNITPAQAAKVQPFLDSPNFDPEYIRKVSTACAGLCQWVRSLIEYHKVCIHFMTLKRRLEEMEARVAQLKNPSVAAAPKESC